MKHFRVIVILFTMLLAPAAARAAELVMAEQAGCEWCEIWDEEVGVIYHRTEAGRIAPLRRVNIHDPMPADLEFIRGLAFTPTFVLVHDGREVGRILGYPGEDFFWGLLDQMIRKLPRDEDWNARSRSLPRETKRGGSGAARRG